MAAAPASSTAPSSFFRCCPSLLLLLLLLLLASSSFLCSAALKPGYQLFIPHGSSMPRSSRAISSELSGGGTWRAEIVHRDALPGSYGEEEEEAGAAAAMKATAAAGGAAAATWSQHVGADRLSRDAARVAALERRLQIAVMGERPSEWKPAAAAAAAELETEEEEKPQHQQQQHQQQQQQQQQQSAGDFRSPIVSGLSQGSGEYFTRFGLGTPPRYSYYVMDTGSDLSWTQCQPCRRCYNQSDPLFDPAASSSYQAVACGTALCAQLLVRACQSDACLYQVSYGDGSFTVGDFALEKATFGGKGGVVLRLAIGCGHDNEGLFQGAAGLLGLGNGKLSFPTQTGAPFSYCLADRFQGGGGGGGASELLFGRAAAPPGSVYTPLLRNPKLATFYFVGLQGISVGGRRLPIPASLFRMAPDGSGGVIVDSGTSITRLTAPAYAALRDAFAAATASLPAAAAVSLFDTCYALAGIDSVSVPTVDFHYAPLAPGAAAATTRLPPANYLIPVDASGTFCFAFAGTNAAFSIIGNMQQQGFRVSFDAAAGRVGFAPSQC